MTDQLLHRPLRKGQLLSPRTKGPNLIDLSQALASLCQSRLARPGPEALDLTRQIGLYDRLFFILVDGLGLDLVQSLPKGSFLRRHLQGELRSLFPAATTAVLNSMACGLWPAQHGVINWFVHLDEIGVSVRPLPFDERFQGSSLTKLGLRPEALYRAPSLAPTFKRRHRFLLPAPIRSSAFSRYVSGQAHSLGYESLSEAFEKAFRYLSQGKDARYLYLYINRFDLLSHHHGKWQAKTLSYLRELDRRLERFWSRSKASWRLVLSADHGFRDIPKDGYFELVSQKRLMAMQRASPGGDSRMAIFYLKAECHQDFVREFRRLYGKRFALLSTAELEASRLLGPSRLSPSARRRLGDFCAISLDGSVLKLEIGEKDRSAHSGLSPEEMRVPLVLA